MQEVSEKIIEERWDKKKDSLKTLSSNIGRLRNKINADLKSENEKDFLTALVISVMLKTAERVGNGNSAKENGHYGVTEFLKKHVKTNDNEVKFKYRGKSGVDHERVITDKRLADFIEQAKKNSPSSRLFTTSDGFEIKANRVNRYLRDFGITAKDIRGHSANNVVFKRLSRLDIAEEEKDRKKQWSEVIKHVAEEVGHGKATLQNHYLLPDMKPKFIEKGKVLEFDMDKYYEGGMVDSNNNFVNNGNKSVGLAIVCNNEILLVHHPKDADQFKGTLSIPKGRQEKNEEGKDYVTAQREVNEEVGILIPQHKILSAEKHKVTRGEREVHYYVIRVNDISKLGKFHRGVLDPKNYQLEEVSYAGFMPFEKAYEYINEMQKPIVEKLMEANKFSGGGLIAPNGNPSNLTPEQYSLVRTPAFKAWFGDWENDPKNSSKVVDENGEPLVQYHFTDSKFNKFKNKESGFHFGDISIEEDLAIAKSSPLAIRMDVFLDIKNPLRVDDSHRFDPSILIEQFINNGFISSDEYDELYEKIESVEDDLTEDEYYNDYALTNKQSDILIEFLRNKGYDGLVYQNKFDSQDSKMTYIIDDERNDIYIRRDGSVFVGKVVPIEKASTTHFMNWSSSITGNVFVIEENTGYDLTEKNKERLKELIDKGGYFSVVNSPKTYNDIELFLAEQKFHDSWVTFSSNQSKLADGKNKNFDSENPDIRFKSGGAVTWKNKYNKKYGYDKDQSHSLKEIAKDTGVSMKGLQQIYNKGIGAYKTNPESVRTNVTSKEQWAMARVYSAVMGGKTAKIDAKELKMENGGEIHYTGIFVDVDELKKKYPPVHPNHFYHHSTIAYRPESVGDLPIGKEVEVKIVGRLTTPNVDTLLVENPYTKKAYPHITLSTAEGIEPVESNVALENQMSELKPLNDSIKGVVDAHYYSGGGQAIDWDELKQMTWEKAVKTLGDLGYTINGKKIQEYHGWQDGEDTLYFEDGIEISFDERAKQFTWWDGEKMVMQRAKTSYDMESFIRSGDKPVFNTLADAKRFVDFITKIGGSKIKPTYKYLITGDSKTYSVPTFTEEQVNEIFKGREVTLRTKDYDDNLKPFINEEIFIYDDSHVFGIDSILRTITLTFKMKGGDWLSKNLRVSIEQDYLATGKPSKGVVEAYTKYIRGEYQSDVKLSDNPEIENIIKELKSMLKPDTKREGGALKEGTEIEMEHKDTIEKLASGKYSVEEGAKMIAQDHLDERVDYYEIVKQEGLEFGGKVVPHRKEFLGTYFGYDSEGKVIRSADEINEGDEAYLQGGVKLVRPSSIWKFRHIRSDKGIYDNIPDWDGEEKSRKYIDELKEDIKVNGIKEPVRLEFDDEGYAFLGEGNHRLVASLELEKEGYDILIPVTTHKYWRGVTNKTESPSRLFTQEKIDKAKELSDRLQYHFDYLSPHVSELELGGIIEGQLHSECNEPHGCGVKFEVGDSGRVIEAERDEAVIVSSAFNDNDHYTIVGTCSQIASALNVIGGGKNFDGGAKIESENGKQVSTEVNSMKSEAKDTDVERRLESGSIIINRRSMADPTIYKAHGTARQIASAINSINGNGVVIENGGAIEKA